MRVRCRRTAGWLALLLACAILGLLLLKLPGRGVDLTDSTFHRQLNTLASGPAGLPARGKRAQGSSACETVHVGLVAVGSNATRAAVTVVKSLLARRSGALALHLMVDADSERVLDTVLTTWALANVTTQFYRIDQFVADVAWVPTAHESGVLGMTKLLYAAILPTNVTRLLALDSDLIFTSDVAELWRLFDAFNATHAIGAAEQQSNWYLNQTHGDHRANVVWPARGRGLNTGVLLLHLTRLRANGWAQRWRKLTRRELIVRHRTGLADQDVLNLVALYHPEWVFMLPCTWNVQVHAHSLNDCHETQGAAVIHWNSPAKQHSVHPRQHSFLDLFWSLRCLDGYSLMQPPLTCSDTDRPLFFAARSNVTLPLSSDPCYGFWVAGVRYYRTHPMLYRYALRKELYACRAGPSGEPLKVAATSELHARQAFLSYLRRKRAGSVEGQWVACEHLGPAPSSTGPLGDLPFAPDVTLCTQLSFDRLPLLIELLRSWEGPLSVAVYLRDADLRDFNTFLERLAISHPAPVAFHAVYQAGAHYPINYLRNVARSEAKTVYTLMLDVDFLPSPGMYRQLRQELGGLAHDAQNSVLVVPAFETTDFIAVVPPSKADLQRRVTAGDFRPFRQKEWPKGHAATDYERWFASAVAYQVTPPPDYEPYLVLHVTMPRFVRHQFSWSFLIGTVY